MTTPIISTNPVNRGDREDLQASWDQSRDMADGGMPVRRNQESFTQELREQAQRNSKQASLVVVRE